MSEKAKTAAEVKAKYGRRKFTGATAGKAILYDYIYKSYQRDEGSTNPNPLYLSMTSFTRKIQTYDEVLEYNLYVNLCAWLMTAFDAAVNARNGLKSELTFMREIATNALAAEHIRRDLLNTSDTFPNADTWLRTMSIDAYTPQSEKREMILNRRKNIDSALKYLKCFNTLIAIIGKKINTPEIETYQLSMRGAELRIEALNESLICLRNDIAMCRTSETDPDITAGEVLANPYRYTPDYLREIMEPFEPIKYPLDPIPAKCIIDTEIAINEILREKSNAWGILMLYLKGERSR